MSNDPSIRPSGPPVAEEQRDWAPRRWVFGSVVLFALLLWVDAALRWEKGFGFLRSEWLRDVSLLFAAQLFVSWLLVRRPSPAWLAVFWAFPSHCVQFIAASAGTSVFDWRNTPVFSFVTHSWVDKLFEQGGVYTALVGTLAYVIWYGAARRILRRKQPNPGALLLLALGIGWIVASTIRFTGFVTIYPDPRLRTPHELHAVALTRSALWAFTFVMGLSLFAAGFYRKQVAFYHRRRDRD